MPWTAPLTWTPGYVIGSSDLNSQLRDNMLYLLAGRPAAFVQHVGTSDYSTTSASFVDVDAANLILTLTLNGSRALLIAACLAGGTVTAGGAFLDWNVDGVARAGGTYGLIGTQIAGAGTQVHGLSVVGYFSGLQSGVAHTFKLQYRGNGSGSAAIYNTNIPITLFGLEI